MAAAERPGATPPGARPLDPPYALVAAVESLLFVAEGPVEPAALARALNVSERAVEGALAELGGAGDGRGIRLQRAMGKVQLISAPAFGPYVERFLGAENEQHLSNAALETLAIVAYRQPVTRPLIESIRGVNSERALLTLRNRGLVEETGRAETVGHPVLFGTTMRFLEYFGLEHPGQLPPLTDSGPAVAPVEYVELED
jgi:segregation and condensation protein B